MQSQEEYQKMMRQYAIMEAHAKKCHESIINSFAGHTLQEKMYMLCYIHDHITKDIAALQGKSITAYK